MARQRVANDTEWNRSFVSFRDEALLRSGNANRRYKPHEADDEMTQVKMTQFKQRALVLEKRPLISVNVYTAVDDLMKSTDRRNLLLDFSTLCMVASC